MGKGKERSGDSKYVFVFLTQNRQSESDCSDHVFRVMARDLCYRCKVVNTFLDGNDVFMCLPTGASKSLCYAVLPY